MLNNQRSSGRTIINNNQDHDHNEETQSPIFRDIHALDPPIRISSPLSRASSSSAEFTTISREFDALVLAGFRARMENRSGFGARTENQSGPNNPVDELNALVLAGSRARMENRSGSGARTENHSGPNNLDIIGEEQDLSEESNETAIVVDSPRRRVRKEEAESKIKAWENAKIAKINNRFRREEVIIHSREGKQLHKASSRMKKVERKLEERRAKALEKMENEIAKAHRKAEERKASAEAKRGIKVVRVVEIANFMRAMGRPLAKRSFF